MGLGERIKEVRKSCDMTQQLFAQRLGLKQNTIATYEIGKTTPSERTLSHICREFQVDEHWLRTGEGNMFAPLSENEQVAAFMGDVLASNDFRTRVIAALAQLSPDQWDVLETLVSHISQGCTNQEQEAPSR